MANPFPGMNPFLERPEHWRNFHQAYIATLYRQLNRKLPPGFGAFMEERLYVVWDRQDLIPDITVSASGKPADELSGSVATLPRTTPIPFVGDAPLVVSVDTVRYRESFIEIRSARPGRDVIATLELLSPTNKKPDSVGWEEYKRKQRSLLRSDIHLIEIDLLRGGAHTVAVPEAVLREQVADWDYLVCLHRGLDNGRFFVWAFTLHDTLPQISVPLLDDQQPILLDLQTALVECWSEGPFDGWLDYGMDLIPSVSPEEMSWIRERIADSG
ncbi:MAG: DUF4058 family protein [Armatimonadaceae bacterium]